MHLILDIKITFRGQKFNCKNFRLKPSQNESCNPVQVIKNKKKYFQLCLDCTSSFLQKHLRYLTTGCRKGLFILKCIEAVVRRCSQYLQENTCVVFSFQSCNFTQKRLQHRCFSLNIAEFLRIAIFIENLLWLLECSVITLKQVQVASAVFLRCFFRKIFLNSWNIGRRISTVKSDVSRVAPP